jgi:hypothetical protein
MKKAKLPPCQVPLEENLWEIGGNAQRIPVLGNALEVNGNFHPLAILPQERARGFFFAYEAGSVV